MAQHEGVHLEQYSHTWTLRDYYTQQDVLAQRFEPLVGLGSAFLDTLAARRTAAFTAAGAASAHVDDPNNPNNPSQLPCRFDYFPQ